jgi:hypothetical protein
MNEIQQTEISQLSTPVEVVFEAVDAKSLFVANAKLAQWWRKTAKVLARAAVVGEIVRTTAGDVAETSNVAQAGDMLVQNPSGEQYLVAAAKFAEKYEPLGTAADERGFAVFQSVSNAVACVLLDRDVEFTAPWGESMRILRGGYLVNAGGNDVYGVQPAAFKETYSRCYPDGQLLDTAVWKDAYATACQDAYDNFHQLRAQAKQADVEASALRAIDASLVGTQLAA